MVRRAGALLLVLFRCWSRVTASSLNPQAELIHFDFQPVMSPRFCVCYGKGKKIRVTIDLTLNNAMASAKKGGVLIGGRSRVVLCVTFGSSPLP